MLQKIKNKKVLKQLGIISVLMLAALAITAIIPVSALAGNPYISAEEGALTSPLTGGETSFRRLVVRILQFFLGFLGLLAVVMIIYGGILYVTSAGEEDGANKGKKIILYAVIGIVIIAVSYALVSTLLGGLGTGTDA